MDVGRQGDLLLGAGRRRRIAEALLPLVGEGQLAALRLPLKEDVVALLGYDLVPGQSLAQDLLPPLDPAVVHHAAVEKVAAVRLGGDTGLGQDPEGLPLAGADPELQLRQGAALQLLPELALHIPPVLRQDELHHLVMEAGAQLLPAVAQEVG